MAIGDKLVNLDDLKTLKQYSDAQDSEIKSALRLSEIYVEQGNINSSGETAYSTARIRTGFLKFTQATTLTSASGYKFQYQAWDNFGNIHSSSDFVTSKEVSNLNYYYRLVIAKTNGTDSIVPSDFASAFTNSFSNCVCYQSQELMMNAVKFADVVQAGAIKRSKLSDAYMNTINRSLTSSDDLNTYTKPDVLYVTAGTQHAPDASNSWIVEVLYVPWNDGARYTSFQFAHRVTNPSFAFCRTYQSTSGVWTDWVINIPDESITRAKLNDAYNNSRNNILTTGDDLNDYTKPDILYCGSGTSNIPNSSGSWIVEILYVPWNNGLRYTAIQHAYSVSDPSLSCCRIYQSSSNEWSDWELNANDSAESKQNVLLLGDSIFGNDGEIRTFIATKCKSCVNGAFGGTRVSVRDGNNDLKYFDGVNIVTALTTQTWTDQDAAAGRLAETYTWIQSRLAGLKAVDMSKVDIIIMDWGTNDYTASQSIETITTAYSTVIDLLQTAYPSIRILVTTPIWRYFSSTENGDNKTYYTGGPTLKEIATAIEQLMKDKRISVLNAYQNMPLSYATASTYYDTNDKTHLNIKGNEVYAGLLVGKIRTLML